MYDHAPPASLGMRDVVAAWLVCLAVAGTVFVYPGFTAEPARKAQTALADIAPAAPRTELCALGNTQVIAPGG